MGCVIDTFPYFLLLLIGNFVAGSASAGVGPGDQTNPRPQQDGQTHHRDEVRHQDGLPTYIPSSRTGTKLVRKKNVFFFNK